MIKVLKDLVKRVENMHEKMRTFSRHESFEKHKKKILQLDMTVTHRKKDQ